MKFLRFFKFIPILIYSYVEYYCQSRISYENASYPDWYNAVLKGSLLLSIVVIIIHLVQSVRGKYSGTETAVYAMIIKILSIFPLINITIYTLIFAVVPVYGWLGAGVLVLYMGSIIAMSGTIQLCSVICLVREKKLSIPIAILCGILSYWLVVDVVVCTILMIRSRKQNRLPINEKNLSSSTTKD